MPFSSIRIMDREKEELRDRGGGKKKEKLVCYQKWGHVREMLGSSVLTNRWRKSSQFATSLKASVPCQSSMLRKCDSPMNAGNQH